MVSGNEKNDSLMTGKSRLWMLDGFSPSQNEDLRSEIARLPSQTEEMAISSNVSLEQCASSDDDNRQAKHLWLLYKNKDD